jgi:predicted DNA-binding transcriptional regulator AlpA
MNSDKRAIERAAGISRPTIYRLLNEGHPDGTE